MAEYTLQQKAFVFSMISSAAANMDGTAPQLEQAVIRKFDKVTTAYPQYLGAPWQLVWGSRDLAIPPLTPKDLTDIRDGCARIGGL
jgi:hypothetical protein